MSIRRSRSATVAAALVLVVVGCGGSEAKDGREGEPGTSTPAGRVDMCELVPKAEIEAIVHTSVASVNGNFSEHIYSKPASYTASCMYMGQRAVVLGVTYPVASAHSTSEALAAAVTKQLRSQVGNDAATDEIFRTTQVRAADGLPAPAAEYEMMGQTVLEVHADGRIFKISAASREDARAVAEKAIAKMKTE